MKKFLLIPFVAVGLAACGSGGGGGAPSTGATAQANFQLTGNGVNASGSGQVSVEVENVSLLNQAAYLNGAESVDVDLDIDVSAQLQGSDAQGNSFNHSINLQDIKETVELTAEYAKGAPNIPTSYSFSETLHQDGYTLRVSGSYNVSTGNLRTDVDVVDGPYNRAFFITNEGTGVKDFETQRPSIEAYTRANEESSSGTFGDQLRRAHTSGWTGKGLTITGANTEFAKDVRKTIAPGADRFHYTDGTVDAQVCRINSSDCFTYTRHGADGNSVYASTNALVSHKFSTITTSQSADIIEQTKNNGLISVDRALSPVGNLR